MAIQKKSLIGNLSATKKAIVATNVASTAPVSTPKLETAKKGHQLPMAKDGRRGIMAKDGRHAFMAKDGRHAFMAKDGSRAFLAKDLKITMAKELYTAKK